MVLAGQEVISHLAVLLRMGNLSDAEMNSLRKREKQGPELGLKTKTYKLRVF
jgi:hypothetical protein